MKTKESWVLFFVIGYIILAQISLALYLPVLPLLAKEFGVKSGFSQASLSVFLFSYGISQLFYGPISDMYGRRPILLFSFLLLMGADLWIIFSNNYLHFMGGRFLQGLACGGLGILSRTILRDIMKGKRLVEYLSYLTIALALSITFAPFLGGQIQHIGGWRTIFLFLFVVTGVLFLFSYCFYKETNLFFVSYKREERKIFQAYKTLLISKNYVSIIVILLLAYTNYMLTLGIAPFIFENYLGLTAVQYGNLTLIPGIAYIGGAFFLRKVKKRSLFAIGALFMVGAGLLYLIVFPFISTIWIALIPIIFIFFAIAIILPRCYGEVLDPFPYMAGMAAGLLGFCQVGGASIVNGMINLFHLTSPIELGILFFMFGIGILFVFFFILNKEKQVSKGK